MSISADSLQTLGRLADREFDLFNTRTATFFNWQAIPMAAYGLNKQIGVLSVVVPVIGVCTAMLWAYVTHRTRLVYKYFQSEIAKFEADLNLDDRIYSNGHRLRQTTRRPFLGITVSAYYSLVFPGMGMCLDLDFFLSLSCKPVQPEPLPPAA